MVVPDADEGEALVQPLQVGVGLVGPVEEAVIVEALGARPAAREREGADLPLLERRVADRLVNIIPQVDDEIDLFLRQMR